LYNEQGLRPDEIAAKLGVSTYTANQIILAARNPPSSWSLANQRPDE